jgi:hypothetical protein
MKSKFGNGVGQFQWMSLPKLRPRWEDDNKVDGVRVWINSSGFHAMQKYAGQVDIPYQMLPEPVWLLRSEKCFFPCRD